MKITNEKTEKKKETILDKIIELRDTALEEFDILEMVEDSIMDIFECNLDCSTCTREEQGKCLQNFKKANLFWIRKVAQDEEILRNIVKKMDEMRGILQKQMKSVLKEIKNVKKLNQICDSNEENIEDKDNEEDDFESVSRKLEETRNDVYGKNQNTKDYNFYS